MTQTYFTSKEGVKIPTIGYGTWLSNDEVQLEKALSSALEVGYRHIDTAYIYENEHIVGKVLKQWFDSGKLRREDVFVTTKLPFAGTHEDRIETCLKTSLERLQLSYVDLYLIHFPVTTKYVDSLYGTPNEDITPDITDHIAVWKKMEEQVDAGRTKSIGLSNFNIKQIERILKSCRIRPACLQVELNVYLQQPDLVNYCHKNGIVVVGYCPLGAPGFNTYMNKAGLDSKPLPNLLNNAVVNTIAEKYKKSAGQVLLRFLFQQHIIPIPKSVNPSRIKENFDIFNFNIEPEDMKKLEGQNVGESARICDFRFFPKLVSHLEFPFPQKS